jgi:hypothetical protein
VSELLAKLNDRYPDFIEDVRFKYFYLNRVSWTQSIIEMIGELEDETQILRIVRLALEVDLNLGARLAGVVQPKFQEQTIAIINALEVTDRDKVDLLDITKSDAAIAGLIDAIDRGFFQHYGHSFNIQAVRILGSFRTESTIPALVKAI